MTIDSNSDFDPNGVAEKGKLFGLPGSLADAKIVILPVPWEVTVSYSNGTADGPQAILEASAQVDLYQADIRDAWRMGLHLAPIDVNLHKKSNDHRLIAKNYIEWLEEGSPEDQVERFASVTSIVDKACAEMVAWVKAEALNYIEQGKVVAVLGGDHSTPLGLMQALASKHSDFGVLQIDAHADLRQAYEGFEYSHASISYNALKLPQISKLVQVGIRDYCEEEVNYIENAGNRLKVFFDKDIKESQFDGKSWKSICDDIVKELPQKVYITFDIDGLDPKLCPNTGTPVPGGFELEQVLYLFQQVVKSGRTIIGFDLNEVSPGDNEWNGNVGARALYRMSALTAVSNQILGWS
ncbi:agmatinase family protein [Peijinzhouia sedimentorum]